MASTSSTDNVLFVEADIPGAALREPMEQHTNAQLTWWLLYRGIRAPTSWKKQQLVAKSVYLHTYRLRYNRYDNRIQEAKVQQLPLVDVDGS